MRNENDESQLLNIDVEIVERFLLSDFAYGKPLFPNPNPLESKAEEIKMFS